MIEKDGLTKNREKDLPKSTIKMLLFTSAMDNETVAPYGSYVRGSPPPWGPKQQAKKISLLLYHQATLSPLPRRGREGL
jgi:hypothetical protein